MIKNPRIENNYNSYACEESLKEIDKSNKDNEISHDFLKSFGVKGIKREGFFSNFKKK